MMLGAPPCFWHVVPGAILRALFASSVQGMQMRLFGGGIRFLRGVRNPSTSTCPPQPHYPTHLGTPVSPTSFSSSTRATS